MRKQNAQPKVTSSDARTPGPLDASIPGGGEETATRILAGGVRDWGEDADSSAEMADREERSRGWGGRELRAAFYATTGDAPALNPGDREGAAAFLHRVQAAIEQGGWVTRERRKLYKLRDKWARRASGADPYFETYGTKRQWADHGRTRRSAEEKPIKDASRRIRAIVWGRVMEDIEYGGDDIRREMQTMKKELELGGEKWTHSMDEDAAEGD